MPHFFAVKSKNEQNQIYENSIANVIFCDELA